MDELTEGVMDVVLKIPVQHLILGDSEDEDGIARWFKALGRCTISLSTA